MALVNSKSALDRFLTLLLRERFRKNKMTILNEHSVLEAILSDISDNSDTNFIYMLTTDKCQQRNNEEHFKTNKTAIKADISHVLVKRKREREIRRNYHS